MKRYRIGVYAICKNEESFVDRWMDSMKEADLIVVTDTGSTDGTVARLRARGAVVYEETVTPWRFDTARNISLSHLPDDVDIAVCTDLDEVFRLGWRAALEKAWTRDATMGNYLFNWSLNEDGTPQIQFTYFKVHARHGYTWVCPVHEFLQYTGQKAENKVFIDGMVLDHFPDKNKPRSTYLPLLEMAVREDPQSDRMAYYLGREYLYAGRWRECIDALMRHLSLPAATWRDERGASMRWIAKSFHKLRDSAQAYSWYYRAIAEVPSMRDAYVELAQCAYDLEDWATVLHAVSQALKIGERSATYVNMGYSWDHTPHDLAAIACYHLGMFEQSLAHARDALSFAPEDKRLQENCLVIERQLPK